MHNGKLLRLCVALMLVLLLVLTGTGCEGEERSVSGGPDDSMVDGLDNLWNDCIAYISAYISAYIIGFGLSIVLNTMGKRWWAK